KVSSRIGWIEPDNLGEVFDRSFELVFTHVFHRQRVSRKRIRRIQFHEFFELFQPAFFFFHNLTPAFPRRGQGEVSIQIKDPSLPLPYQGRSISLPAPSQTDLPEPEQSSAGNARHLRHQ